MSGFPGLFLSMIALSIVTFSWVSSTIVPRNIGPENPAPETGVPFRIEEDVALENMMRMAPSPGFEFLEQTLGRPFAISSSEPGFIRTVGVGATVTRGITATFSFSITVNGILATDLVQNDEPFRNVLPIPLIIPFLQLTGAYRGGLNIPFLELVGANLNENVTTIDQETAAPTVPEFRDLSLAARQVLEAQPITGVRISGMARITGDSLLPQTFLAFIKVANVQLTNGARVQIISANAGDVEFASADGSGPLQNSSVVEDFRIETF